ncbi:MAG: hypothetical protein WC807_21505 [Hyphomicrobium sp.]|jgi:hypothetical protein
MRFGLLFGLLTLTIFVPSSAFAYSEQVRNACKNDYLAHCNTHEVGSESLRQCMRNAGPKLEPTCVNALVAAGEVSAAEVAKKRASK